ncbi:MAG: hypothetical protein ACRDZO_16555, partial [Egibacteraceae bacterium]
VRPVRSCPLDLRDDLEAVRLHVDRRRNGQRRRWEPGGWVQGLERGHCGVERCCRLICGDPL